MSEFDQFPNYEKYQQKKILAIDYGHKVIGLAAFTPGREPFPYLVERVLREDYQNGLKQRVEEEYPDIFVLGLPVHMDGKESDITAEVKAFAKKLKGLFPDIPIIFQDERLTTYEAKERMKTSPRFMGKVDPKKVDSMSALIILEDFIKKT